jgi:hypothetical protein
MKYNYWKLRFALMVSITVLLTLMTIGAQNGCEDPLKKQVAETSRSIRVSGFGEFVKMQFEGHEYLVFNFSGGPESGGAICHSESCPCKPKPTTTLEK